MPTRKMKLSVVAFALEVIKYTEKYGAYPREADKVEASAATSLLRKGFVEEVAERALKATPALFTAFGLSHSKRHQDLLAMIMKADDEYFASGLFPPVKFLVTDEGKWLLNDDIYPQRY